MLVDDPAADAIGRGCGAPSGHRSSWPAWSTPATGVDSYDRGVTRQWTHEELVAELGRFEQELRAAGLAEDSVKTYVGRSEIFLRWLVGQYTPQGPR